MKLSYQERCQWRLANDFRILRPRHVAPYYVSSWADKYWWVPYAIVFVVYLIAVFVY